MLYLNRSACSDLAKYILEGTDQFLYGKSEYPDLSTGNNTEEIGQNIDNVQKHMSDVLSGNNAAATRRALKYKGNHLIDDVTAKIMRHYGIHPAMLLVLSEVITERGNGLFSVSLTEDMEGTVIYSSSENPYWFITIGQGWRWSSQYTLKGPALPQTVMESMSGRKLKSVINHPVLDQVDLTIKDVIKPRIISGEEMRRRMLGDVASNFEISFEEEPTLFSPLGITALLQTEDRIKAKFA